MRLIEPVADTVHPDELKALFHMYYAEFLEGFREYERLRDCQLHRLTPMKN